MIGCITSLQPMFMNYMPKFDFINKLLVVSNFSLEF